MHIEWMSFGTKMIYVSAALVIFGAIYNWIVTKMQKRTSGHYTAEFVVIGVLVTLLAGSLLIGLENVLILIVLFAASGTPMIIGSWLRVAYDHDQAKKEQQL